MFAAFETVASLLRISRGVPGGRWRMLAGIVTASLAGLLYPMLIAVVSAAASQGPNRALLWGFLALCVAAPCCRFASQVLFDALGTRAIFDLRLDLCRKILAAPLSRLEAVGAHRLLASLADDVTAITTTFGQLSVLTMQVGVTVGALGYMAWLSPRLFLLAGGLFALGVACFRLSGVRTAPYFERARRETDAMFGQFRDLISGSKELKLQRERRRALLAGEIVPTGEVMSRATLLGATVWNVANGWGNLLFFLVLGLVLARSGEAGSDLRIAAGFSFALLYLKAPVEVLVLMLPALGRSGAAVAAIERLRGELSATTGDGGEEDDRPAAGGAWRELELRDVRHHYTVAGEPGGFTLGPISLALAPGEIVFLIGGNGSGKTTLAKILTGLYPPEGGQILLDGVPVTDLNRDEYRQNFAAVFADFHLFDTLLAPPDTDLAAAAAGHLRRLQLAGKVTVADGRLSTVDLSQGQRKRLGLLSAALEDRPIYFFDEWAADQDPAYKQIFYREILPEMKARGKTVVVISHDDAYYPAADRLIRLTDGRIEWERRPGEPGAAPPAWLKPGAWTASEDHAN